MAKEIYIGVNKNFTVQNLLDYNAFSNNDGGYWGRWHLSGTYNVGWTSSIAPPNGKRSLFFSGFTASQVEATYQLTVMSGSIKVHLIPSHKYYFSVYLRQPTVVGSFDCYWPIAEPPVISKVSLSAANTWERKSTIVSRTGFAEGDYDVRVDFNNPTSGSSLYISNLVLVDLTAAFGAGGEPDKSWCDDNFDFNDTQYNTAAQTQNIQVTKSVAQNVTNLYVGSGTANRIVKGYIGVNGIARLCYENYQINSNFASNGWSTIIYACQTNQVPASWRIGDSKEMLIGGTNYQIDIIGKNHDDYSDGSGKAPITFQMHNCYNTKYRMDNSNSNFGGWLLTEMKQTTMGNILSQMPVNIQNAIRQVAKKYGIGSSTISTSNDKLFLLSEIEIDNFANYAVQGEGTQYEYYQNGGSAVKTSNGASTQWWTRSAVRYNSENFCNVSAGGVVAWGASNTTPLGVSVAFCF